MCVILLLLQRPRHHPDSSSHWGVLNNFSPEEALGSCQAESSFWELGVASGSLTTGGFCCYINVAMSSFQLVVNRDFPRNSPTSKFEGLLQQNEAHHLKISMLFLGKGMLHLMMVESKVLIDLQNQSRSRTSLLL